MRFLSNKLDDMCQPVYVVLLYIARHLFRAFSFYGQPLSFTLDKEIPRGDSYCAIVTSKFIYDGLSVAATDQIYITMKKPSHLIKKDGDIGENLHYFLLRVWS